MSSPIKNVKETVWVFDTEYVPCPVTGRRFLGLPEEMPDSEVVGHMYAYADATEDNPTPMMKSVFYKIVSIAAVLRTVKRDPEGEYHIDLKLWSVPRIGEEFDEKAIIQGFLRAIGQKKPQLVGFASNMFDLTLLFQRAIILGCDVAEFCQRPNKPWDDYPDYFGRYNDYNIDLIEVLGGVRWLNPKLNEVALACGVPAKIGMDGSEVAGAWMEGRGREIVNYNEIDALTTYLVWLKTVITCGLITQENGLKEQIDLMDLIKAESELRPHLLEFYWQWYALNNIECPSPRPEPEIVIEEKPKSKVTKK